jgi:hypothetical protein
MPTFVRHMRDDYYNEKSEKITHEEMFLNLDHVEFIEFRNNIYSDPIAIVYLSSGVRLELLADQNNIMTGSDTKGYTS